MKVFRTIKYSAYTALLVLGLAVPAIFAQSVEDQVLKQENQILTAVKAEIPYAHVLESAYPNPFTAQTVIRFGLKQAQPVKVVLHDILGRQLRVLYDGIPKANVMYPVQVNADGLPSGVYVVRLVGPNFATTQTITRVK